MTCSTSCCLETAYGSMECIYVCMYFIFVYRFIAVLSHILMRKTKYSIVSVGIVLYHSAVLIVIKSEDMIESVGNVFVFFKRSQAAVNVIKIT
jgi:hypothetical protein